MDESERPTGVAVAAEDRDTRALRAAILAKMKYSVGRDIAAARDHDWLLATVMAVRDRIVDRWMDANQRTIAAGHKRVYYLSLEFLIGRLLSDTLSNLGLAEAARKALAGLNVDLDRLRALEPDAALGNGGLGRLAACFMESMASLSLPAYGYGIRYEHGLFRQVIADGRQREWPEDWLSFGNPWEFERPDVTYAVPFGGAVEVSSEADGTLRHVWRPAEIVRAVAFDTPVVGWRGRHVNTLRLWSARAVDPLQLETFNAGDYLGAMADRARAEAISRVLYPSDATPAGQELRLRQEFFFTSASLQDLLSRHRDQHGTLASLPDRAALQLNDTHPAIAVAELMRLLVDEHRLAWDEAWSITTRTLNYTNHTLLPEALESWPVWLMERLLPRHVQIIYEINWRHLNRLHQAGRLDAETAQAVSLVDERNGRRIRMGHLAFLGAHKVNGVSALHTRLMRETVFRDLHALEPDKIVNKTNGITFRRWLHQANPGLTRLLVSAVGERALDDAEALEEVARFADSPGFRAAFKAQRAANKMALAKLTAERIGVAIDPDALFDVQIKRVHEYKRQFLNILETIALYQAIKAEPKRAWTPRVKIFAGKAAASYYRAKLIIKLAHDVAEVVNKDPDVAGRLKLVFLPNYNVSLAEAIIPAADLSEQISTAGLEASGTGNMKLALNGALTIGTLDGANIEIRDRVGAENIVIFGLTAREVAARKREQARGAEAVAFSPRLGAVLHALRAGAFSPDEPDRFRDLVEAVLGEDPYMLAADFESYWAAQRQVDDLWGDPDAWWRMSVLNTARVGWFSSDRTIREYADEIWGVRPGLDPA